MANKILQVLAASVLIVLNLNAQDHTRRFSEIDIFHYRFQLELSDENNLIRGEAKVDVQFLQDRTAFDLDLVAKDKATGKGMMVKKIQHKSKGLDFEHQGSSLLISLNKPAQKGEIRSFVITYEGIPADGLIIGENKYGDRTFFGDNWPDRARHWLPTVDHPSDKATVEFIVTAPNHYQVIANGVQIEETNITDDLKLTHWKTSAPLPTKVMVFGAARFAVNLAGYVNHVPVTSWVYRQDRESGFGDYEPAVEILDFFYKKMGSYPYEKLANVQSKTRYGGMENAGNIFYNENSVNGLRDQEELIAHEIAHQWFGNSASEASWHHIWLSEGFATYMTDLYVEEVQGRESFHGKLKSERQRVISFAHQRPVPVIDTSVKDYRRLLNANSYQKGAWVLHMLRREVGDEAFWRGIRAYYEAYKFSNAFSEDFKQVMERVSGKDLGQFFQQWLYQPGHPVLKIESRKITKRRAEIVVRQVQDYVFNFPLDLEVISDSGRKLRKTVRINSKNQKIKIKLKGEIQQVIADPDHWLLFERG